jgi:hypothetical protein
MNVLHAAFARQPINWWIQTQETFFILAKTAKIVIKTYSQTVQTASLVKVATIISKQLCRQV